MAQMPLVAVLDGLQAGAVEHGIEVRVVLDHSRRRPVEWARSAVRMAAAYRDSGVVGFGVAGDETAPLAPYVSVLAEATETGVHLVHHAGETAGPASVWEAVRLGRAERIGHGFRVLEDPSLVAWLRDRQLPLEVCPSSNVALGLVSSIANHPLPRLREAGLAVSLNTDIPAVTGRALSDEYETARTTFGCSDSELAELAHAAVGASFAPAGTTVRMHAGIESWLAAQPGGAASAAPVLPVARK